MAALGDSIPQFMLEESLPMTSSRGVNAQIHGRYVYCPSYCVRDGMLFIAHNHGIKKWGFDGRIAAEWEAEGFVHDLGFKGDTLFALVAGPNTEWIYLMDSDFNPLRRIELTGLDLPLHDGDAPAGIRLLPLRNGFWGRFDRYHAKMLYDPSGNMKRGIFRLTDATNESRAELIKVLENAPSDTPWDVVEVEKSGFLPVGLFRVYAKLNNLHFDPWQTTDRNIGSMQFAGLFEPRGEGLPDRDYSFAGTDDQDRWYFSFGMTIYRVEPETGEVEYLQAESIIDRLPRKWQICKRYKPNARIDEQGNLVYLLASRQTGEIQLIRLDGSNFKTF